ncbi:MAG: TolC family protein [Pseudomonadales bacterium]|nr:TolC family protein [Pseudomonadales bacterium]
MSPFVRRLAPRPQLLYLALLLFPLPLPARAADACIDLPAAVRSALAVDPGRRVVEAGYRYADRIEADGSHWTSGNPTVYGSWISDAPLDDLGLREYEGGFNLPFRYPGEKRALAEEGDAAQRSAVLADEARTLVVAGAVREAWWDVADARVALERAEHEVDHLGEIDRLVAARVARGDAAPMDRDLTALELEAAREEAARARGELAATRRAWQLLTGCGDAPPAEPELPAAAASEEGLAHPALGLAETRRDEAQARLAAAEARPGNPPSLGMLVRRERGGPGSPWIDAVGVSLTVPVGRSGYRERARGDAERAFAEADAAVAQLARDLARERSAARERLEAARAARVAARARRDHAERALVRAHRAHEAGEWTTLDLLRVEGTAAEARLAAQQAHTAVGRAVSRLNQLAGELPR